MNFYKSSLYRVFCTPVFPGNPVTLHEAKNLKDDHRLLLEAQNSATEDNVFFTVISDNSCKVRFFSRTQEFVFCGHGLLALGYHLSHRFRKLHMNVTAPSERSWQLVAVRNVIWIRMPVMQGMRCINTDNYMRGLLNKLDFGYDRLYAFTDGVWAATVRSLQALKDFPVQELRILEPQQGEQNFNTAGALILTLSFPDGSYGLRYFTPWHGKTEDSATGSAQAYLAPLWLCSGHLATVYQHSPEGVAEMQVTLLGDKVWLTGNVIEPAMRLEQCSE